MKRTITTAPTSQMMLFMRPPMSPAMHGVKEEGLPPASMVLETSLPSTIWVVRVSLAYGEVFPDAASRTSVWLA